MLNETPERPSWFDNPAIRHELHLLPSNPEDEGHGITRELSDADVGEIVGICDDVFGS